MFRRNLGKETVRENGVVKLVSIAASVFTLFFSPTLSRSLEPFNDSSRIEKREGSFREEKGGKAREETGPREVLLICNAYGASYDYENYRYSCSVSGEQGIAGIGNMNREKICYR